MPANFPLVAAENTYDLNRDITSIDTTTIANNTTIAHTSVEDTRFVSNPIVHNERQIVTHAQKGIYKHNPKYALTVLYTSLNEL